MDWDREKKTERLWLLLGPTLKAEVEARARKDRRPVAEWVRLQLETMVEADRGDRRQGGAVQGGEAV